VGLVGSLDTVQVTDQRLFRFDEATFVRDLAGLYEPWAPAQVAQPELVVLNEELASELGLDAAALRSPGGVAALAGNVVPEGATPVAQAYSGHQFGGWSPRLGDGRALLLGELVDVRGRRRDLHLKGSGRTPFARGGDGKAALGPMLREHVMGEAMHALGIPTTRALSVVATGELIVREQMLPGAVLARVAASHLRVGTFQYAAASGDPDLLRRLADHAIERHHPQAARADNRYLALFEAVLDAQAALVARWMLVGFVHGVMNTDNVTISGETIDYGPCAFMDSYDPATVFSSIDHGGRYAYGNQPVIAQWDLARLAEALLALISDDQEISVAQATDLLRSFPDRYGANLLTGMRAKLGLEGEDETDGQLVEDLLELMKASGADWTSTFRALASHLRGDEQPLGALMVQDEALRGWLARWSGRTAGGAADAMDQVNPVYIPRNHLVEEALDDATAGDLSTYERLISAVTAPFDVRPGFEDHAKPAPASFGSGYQTFCGT